MQKKKMTLAKMGVVGKSVNHQLRREKVLTPGVWGVDAPRYMRGVEDDRKNRGKTKPGNYSMPDHVPLAVDACPLDQRSMFYASGSESGSESRSESDSDEDDTYIDSRKMAKMLG